jgi:enhancer of mRNA-decapping protein 4
MASSGNSGNPNQTQQTQFDLQKLFKVTTTNQNQNQNQNLNSSPSFPSPSSLSTPPPSSYPTPSSSYPPPTGTYPYHLPHYLPFPNLQQQENPLILQHHPQMHAPQRPIFQPPSSSPTSPNPNTTSGARLMALLGTQNPPSNQESEFSVSVSANSGSVVTSVSSPVNNMASPNSTPTRMLSTKLPKGRHLKGENVVYDIDVKLLGEMQPQLEVTPITKYASDPGLVLGRQIAVNRSYICYGLKLGAIRVLNINTALRYLLRGHTQVRDVLLLACILHFDAFVVIEV